jgi:hypothetical protein
MQIAPAFVGALVAVIPPGVPMRGLVACDSGQRTPGDDWRS